MEIPFYKLRSGSSDYILVNNISNPYIDEDLYPAIASSICKRRRGVGASGVIFCMRGTETKLRIAVFNRGAGRNDIGTDPMFCLGRYAFDSGYFANGELGIETPVGHKKISCIDSSTFKVSVGEPTTLNGISLSDVNPDYDFIQPVTVDGKSVPIIPLKLNGTYGVVITSESKNKIREMIRRHQFTDSPQVISPLYIKLITQEEARVFTPQRRNQREIAESAGVSVVAAVLMGLCDRICAVRTMGSQYFVDWSESNQQVYVAGSAEYTFSGQYVFEETQSVGPVD